MMLTRKMSERKKIGTNLDLKGSPLYYTVNQSMCMSYNDHGMLHLRAAAPISQFQIIASYARFKKRYKNMR